MVLQMLFMIHKLWEIITSEFNKIGGVYKVILH